MTDDNLTAETGTVTLLALRATRRAARIKKDGAIAVPSARHEQQSLAGDRVMRRCLPAVALLLLPGTWAVGDQQPERPWRALPLIADGKVHPDWVQVGWGGFGVVDGSLRTDCDEKG